MTQLVESVAALILVSEDAPRLVRFYRDALGIPLEDEQHGGGGEALHYGCQLGKLHFAIHPVDNWRHAPETGPGAVRIAFRVSDIERVSKALAERRVARLSGPDDLGWSQRISRRDPAGNLVERVELKRL